MKVMKTGVMRRKKNTAEVQKRKIRFLERHIAEIFRLKRKRKRKLLKTEGKLSHGRESRITARGRQEKKYIYSDMNCRKKKLEASVTEREKFMKRVRKWRPMK